MSAHPQSCQPGSQFVHIGPRPALFSTFSCIYLFLFIFLSLFSSLFLPFFLPFYPVFPQRVYSPRFLPISTANRHPSSGSACCPDPGSPNYPRGTVRAFTCLDVLLPPFWRAYELCYTLASPRSQRILREKARATHAFSAAILICHWCSPPSPLPLSPQDRPSSA